jgi:manganese/zinc/iron transport system permease protein
MLNSYHVNPYYGQQFLEFIWTFLQRVVLFLKGNLSIEQLASDEIQVLVLVGVAISSALLGTFLVLRRMTMLANSLSHTILIGIVIAYFISLPQAAAALGQIAPMQAMLLASLFTGIITTFLTEFLTKMGRIQEDASTGLVFTSLFAIGIILVTLLTRNAHIGIEAVMGNADALQYQDLFWVYAIVFFNVMICFLFFKEFTLTTFDPYLAYAMGFSPLFFNYLLMAQVSATTITSFRAIGVLLVLAFITGPPLIARLLTYRLSSILILSISIGTFCAFMGVAITRHILTVYGIALSTSGVVVCVIVVAYLAVLLLTLIRKKTMRKNFDQSSIQYEPENISTHPFQK